MSTSSQKMSYSHKLALYWDVSFMILETTNNVQTLHKSTRLVTSQRYLFCFIQIKYNSNKSIQLRKRIQYIISTLYISISEYFSQIEQVTITSRIKGLPIVQFLYCCNQNLSVKYSSIDIYQRHNDVYTLCHDQRFILYANHCLNYVCKSLP